MRTNPRLIIRAVLGMTAALPACSTAGQAAPPTERGPVPGTAPPGTDLTGQELAATLAPRLGEVLYVGDARTPGGQPRAITAPRGATTLYLGFPDAWDFRGKPSHYADNTGELSVQTRIQR